MQTLPIQTVYNINTQFDNSIRRILCHLFYVYSSLLAADQHWSLKIKNGNIIWFNMKINYGNIWFNIDFYLYLCCKYKLMHWREFNIHVTLYIDSVLYASPVKVDCMSFGTPSTVDCSIP